MLRYDVSEIGFSALSRIQQRYFDQDFRPGIIVESVYPAGDNAPSTNMNILDDIGGVTIEQGLLILFFLNICYSIYSEAENRFI